MDHVDYVTDYWTDKIKDTPTIKKYLQYIWTMHSFSIGIFLRSNPNNPVSWVCYSDYGHSVFLYTIPEHRGCGLGGNTLASLYIKLMENGIYPLGERIRGHIQNDSYRHVEKCFPGYTWRDASLENATGNLHSYTYIMFIYYCMISHV